MGQAPAWGRTPRDPPAAGTLCGAAHGHPVLLPPVGSPCPSCALAPMGALCSPCPCHPWVLPVLHVLWVSMNTFLCPCHPWVPLMPFCAPAAHGCPVIHVLPAPLSAPCPSRPATHGCPTPSWHPCHPVPSARPRHQRALSFLCPYHPRVLPALPTPPAPTGAHRPVPPPPATHPVPFFSKPWGAAQEALAASTRKKTPTCGAGGERGR